MFTTITITKEIEVHVQHIQQRTGDPN